MSKRNMMIKDAFSIDDVLKKVKKRKKKLKHQKTEKEGKTVP